MQSPPEHNRQAHLLALTTAGIALLTTLPNGPRPKVARTLAYPDLGHNVTDKPPKLKPSPNPPGDESPGSTAQAA
jgi:hypothetical protein